MAHSIRDIKVGDSIMVYERNEPNRAQEQYDFSTAREPQAMTYGKCFWAKVKTVNVGTGHSTFEAVLPNGKSVTLAGHNGVTDVTIQ